MKQTRVRKLQDECLLNEFQGLAQWAGDDYAVDPITPNACRRLDAARKEILRRMLKITQESP